MGGAGEKRGVSEWRGEDCPIDSAERERQSAGREEGECFTSYHRGWCFFESVRKWGGRKKKESPERRRSTRERDRDAGEKGARAATSLFHNND
jgi:hypothetical protein